MNTSICDECGRSPADSVWLTTGRVLKDGIDIGQSVDLCKEHYPTNENPMQPNNCFHIEFHWPHAT